MMMRIENRKRNKGIGLLELMLSLAIIAVLLIMATRYFQGARANQQINQAIQAFQDVYSACSQQQLTAPAASCAISDLVKNGYLSAGYTPSSTDSGTNPMNPFGGDLTSTISEGVLDVQMTLVPVRNNICSTISKQLFSSLSMGQSITAGSSAFTVGTTSVDSITCGSGQEGDASVTQTIEVKY